jgi:hypothetical protein
VNQKGVFEIGIWWTAISGVVVVVVVVVVMCFSCLQMKTSSTCSTE